MTDRPARSRDAAYFDRLYDKNPDPWDFTGSAYEHEKYAATIGMLSGRRFARGLEIGCSIGVLTAQLAGCCDALLAVDIAEQALAQAKTRCAGHANIAFDHAKIPEDWPAGSFDLIIFSEILYFLVPADIERAAKLAEASLAADGVVLLVNYTEDINEPCSGDEAAELFIKSFSRPDIFMRQTKDTSFRIDVLSNRN